MTKRLHFRGKRIFLEAIEQPAGEREAFVRRACRGDESVRHEVETLLACHDAGAELPDAGLHATGSHVTDDEGSPVLRLVRETSGPPRAHGRPLKH